jgi:hypothetical protein
MLIKPDGYDKNIRYYENLDQDGYLYELYVNIKNKKCVIMITDCGVSLHFRDSLDFIQTNIVPSSLFPKCNSLSWKQIEKILKTLEHIGFEGVRFTGDEFKAFYK